MYNNPILIIKIRQMADFYVWDLILCECFVVSVDFLVSMYYIVGVITPLRARDGG